MFVMPSFGHYEHNRTFVIHAVGTRSTMAAARTASTNTITISHGSLSDFGWACELRGIDPGPSNATAGLGLLNGSTRSQSNRGPRAESRRQ